MVRGGNRAGDLALRNSVKNFTHPVGRSEQSEVRPCKPNEMICVAHPYAHSDLQFILTIY